MTFLFTPPYNTQVLDPLCSSNHNDDASGANPVENGKEKVRRSKNAGWELCVSVKPYAEGEHRYAEELLPRAADFIRVTTWDGYID